ncbi:MAG: helix-turn-helix domain-containing protein, partial [Planctomycetota bacterium]|nr:helix-turn-helix domain-containing protein [Planctomycetota bacterium]
MKSNGLTPQLAALRRGFAILGRLAQARRGCAFSELRQAAGGVSAASLSRLLKVMRDEGLVARDDKTGIYTLGQNFLALARTAIGNRSPAEIVSPILERLAQETGESAAWFELNGDQPFLAAKSEVADGFHYIAVGQRMPRVLPHGFGMVIAAWAGEHFVKRHAPLPLPAREYRRLLQQIREGRLLVCDL